MSHKSNDNIQASSKKSSRTSLRTKSKLATSKIKVDDEKENIQSNKTGATKKDRQKVKHDALLHRIAKTAPGVKRHARSKRSKANLAANLKSLLEALPSRTDSNNQSIDSEEEWQGISDDDTERVNLPAGLNKIANLRRRKGNNLSTKVGRIEMKTMRTRPGAMKRKMKIETAERDRFARNMAQMAPISTNAVASSSTGDKWQALRNFVGQTMQKSTLFDTRQ